ncbi:MAG: glucosamine-6-phosphate deaminase [Tissierellaceae bacterium]|nr:glucosamine-6-phosphate deaminase [Tissierellaceae bacterium]
MKIIVEKDYESMSKKAGKILIDTIKANPKIVLGLATGSTPIGLYKELIRSHREDDLDFSNVTTFNLDEYIGISKDHPNSYGYFMYEELFKHINIPMNNTHIPHGEAEDLEEYCKYYDDLIQSHGGIDIQVLGIGENGHIAFNEPSEYLSIGTSIVELTDNTIKANSRFFGSEGEVPKSAISMGIGGILKARKIILLASGETKAPIIGKLLRTKGISTMIPASFLLLHPNVTVIVDEAAYKEMR